MAKIRLNPLSSTEKDFNHSPDESLQELFNRFQKEHHHIDDDLAEYYEILIEGQAIPRDMWPFTKPGNQNVMIAMVPRGDALKGTSGTILKTAVIAIATYFAGNAGTAAGGALFGALAATAAAVGTSYLLNALIPPDTQGLEGLGEGYGYNQQDSQMYTISGQTNAEKKFGVVPKVYGWHRHFPNIAAAPYTSLEADEQGNIAQYFYCIYDFGLGPNIIDNLSIGGTSILEFNEASYYLVDFNKPEVSEGEWDDALRSNLTLYRGDVAQVSVGVALNKNQTDFGAEEYEYQATRSADDSGDGDEQEITVTFVAPQGLTTYGTDGNRAARNVDVRVEFAEEGTEDWKGHDDSLNVDYFSFSQGSSRISDSTLSYVIPTVGTEKIRSWNGGYRSQFLFQYARFPYHRVTYFIPPGQNTIDVTNFLNVGTKISYRGTLLGEVTNRVSIGGGYRYTLSSPFTEEVVVLTETAVYIPDYGGYWRHEDISITSTIVASYSGDLVISGNKTTAMYFSVNFKPKTTEQIKIRVTRLRSYGGYSFSVKEDLTWFTMTTRFDRLPIVTDKRHTFIELRVKATDQLNGSIRNLSGEVQSVLDVYDDTTETWNKEVTQNPAWVIADLLTGQINKNAIDKSKLDTSSLIEWAEHCDEIPTAFPGQEYSYPRFKTNFIMDYKITLSKQINQICSASQAAFVVNNGKYGVMIDKKKTVPVQIFTPKNSSGFSSNRSYANMPNAIKAKYVDAASDWGIKEEVVYNTGYDSTTAETFLELDVFACTNNEQAWRYGKYTMAQMLLRQENISITVDFENLVCTRGDYVLLQNDVMKVGGTPSRVKSVSGTTITLDDAFTTAGYPFGYSFRGVSGVETGTMTIISATEAIVEDAIPSVDDLIVWGEVDKVTINAVVKTITPGPNFTATLTLVERANEVHDAESSEELPVYSPQISTADSDFLPPGEVQELSAASTYDCRGAGYIYTIEAVWIAPTVSAVDIYEVYVDSGTGFNLEAYSNISQYTYEVKEENLGVEHKVKVIGVAANGNKLSLGEVSAVYTTPESKTSAPSDVDSLYLNVTNETLQLEWTLIEDCDAQYYLIRYSPSLTASWSSSIPLQKVDKNTSIVSIQARTGSYFIKAIDFNSNESTNAASAITSIPDLVNLNVVDQSNDFPALEGNREKVIDFSGSLILQEKVSGAPGVVEYWSEGYYTYKDLLDLGEIYTVRLQSLIEAEGYSSDDLMVNWAVLADINPLSTATVSDWDVETQYRSTDNFITMSTWAALSDVAILSGGSEEVWTEWRKLTIGDFTGRVFQFRLRLISNKESISPRVFEGIIKSDMPDRVESFNNIVAPIAGYNLTYSPHFAGPGTTPNIQITQDNSQTGDYYIISNKTLAGFTINFFDKNDVAVSRQFDTSIKGYGRKAVAVI